MIGFLLPSMPWCNLRKDLSNIHLRYRTRMSLHCLQSDLYCRKHKYLKNQPNGLWNRIDNLLFRLLPNDRRHHIYNFQQFQHQQQSDLRYYKHMYECLLVQSNLWANFPMSLLANIHHLLMFQRS